MTFDKIPPLPPLQALALWRLLAAMTRWEPLDRGAAEARLVEAGRCLDLPAQAGPPPPFPELPARLETFVQSLSVLRGAPRSMRLLALRGALEVALGSGTLPLAQNHALRTVVDALNLESGDLAALMSDRTGAELPSPWDPSLKPSWTGRGGTGPGPAGVWDDAGPHPSPLPEPQLAAPMAGDRIARIKALAMLGLDEGADEAAIKRAFHRVSKVHHPDHYASLGHEAAGEADLAFRRLKDAYEFLVRASA